MSTFPVSHFISFGMVTLGMILLLSRAPAGPLKAPPHPPASLHVQSYGQAAAPEPVETVSLEKKECPSNPAEAPTPELPPVEGKAAGTKAPVAKTPSALPVKGGPGVVWEQTVESMGQKSRITTYVTGGAVRSDMGSESSSLLYVQSWDSIHLMHSSRMAMKTPGAQMKSIMANVPKTKPPVPVDTGKTEMVGRFQCRKFELREPAYESTLWIATTWPNQDKIEPLLQSLQGVPVSNIHHEALKGIVVKSVTVAGGRTSVLTLTSLKLQDLPASLFSAPSDYQSMGE